MNLHEGIKRDRCFRSGREAHGFVDQESFAIMPYRKCYESNRNRLIWAELAVTVGHRLVAHDGQRVGIDQ